VAGSVTRKVSAPVAGSPVVATLRAYSVDPGTRVTDAVWMATTASCLSPRCPSLKLVKAVAAV
jgi:hypothetical protein